MEGRGEGGEVLSGYAQTHCEMSAAPGRSQEKPTGQSLQLVEPASSWY